MADDINKNSGCKICANEKGNKIHSFEENMFGTGEKFKYLECGHCGCVQLLDSPTDLSKYYPGEYANFNSVNYTEDGKIISLIRRIKSQLMLSRYLWGFVRWITNSIFSGDFISKLAPANLTLNDRILDLGAGNGERILKLYKRGFKHVSGIDPFISSEIKYGKNVKVLKKDIFEIEGQWDLIMLNHSLEHMPNPKEILTRINQLVPPGKKVLIRIPVARSYSYEKYKQNWVALDPPRHFFLHTTQSIEILSEECGFKLEKVIHDSMEYQFVGSEQLEKGIKLRDERSYYMNKSKSIFTESDIKRFKRFAKKLNRSGKGDAACFYLIKK